MPPATRAARVAAVDAGTCDQCGLCLPLCPPAAIRLTRQGLTIHAATCTGCEKCIAPCPVAALRMVDA